MKIRLYGYPKCSTCIKAQKFLKQRGLPFQAIDITAQPPTKTELTAMLAQLGFKLQGLFNTSGQVYRDMNLKEQLARLSTEEALELLGSNGKLIKRPILLIDDAPVAVGFNETKWSTFL